MWHGGICKMKCKYGEMFFHGCGYEKCCRAKPKPKPSAATHCVPSIGILQISSLIFVTKLRNVLYQCNMCV